LRSRRETEIRKNIVVVVAATMVAGLLISPADARPKKQKRPDAQRRYDVQTQTPSLDGRITGRTRTCWFETLQYDGLWGYLTVPTAIEVLRPVTVRAVLVEFQGPVDLRCRERRSRPTPLLKKPARTHRGLLPGSLAGLFGVAMPVRHKRCSRRSLDLVTLA
jgi:hypothetical protein